MRANSVFGRFPGGPVWANCLFTILLAGNMWGILPTSQFSSFQTPNGCPIFSSILISYTELGSGSIRHPQLQIPVSSIRSNRYSTSLSNLATEIGVPQPLFSDLDNMLEPQETHRKCLFILPSYYKGYREQSYEERHLCELKGSQAQKLLSLWNCECNSLG